MLFLQQVLIFVSWGAARGFNVAPAASLYASHSPDSYFGLTVALLNNPPRLIVGAPRSNSSHHVNLNQPGAVFSYNIANGTLADNEQIILEAAGEEIHRNLGYWDKKDDSWIGGALDVGDDATQLTTCGFRWMNQIYKTENSEDFLNMNGVCYSLTDSQNLTVAANKLIPTLNLNKQYYLINKEGEKQQLVNYYKYSQAGVSIHLSPSNDVIVGAPGVLEWRGSIVLYKNGNYRDSIIPNPIFTSLNTSLSYLGYAVSSGVFHADERLLVASAPRTGHTGSVIIFGSPTRENAPLNIRAQLNGWQMGEYFGATICVADVDGDKLDDILVGAPLHASENAHDSGIVYYYTNSMIWDGRPPLRLEGNSIPGGRFGSAVATIGDTDLDGFTDIAVGAPYEEHGGTTGSIYIYNGSPSGLKSSPSQVIKASDLPFPLRGFGISISRGLDIDGNKYPDFAAGAYESSHAVVLRTRPVFRLQARVTPSIGIIYTNTSEILIQVFVTCEGNYLPKNPGLVALVSVAADKHYGRVTVDRPRDISLEICTSSKLTTSVEFVLKFPQPHSSWPGRSLNTAVPVVAKITAPSPQDCLGCAIMDPATKPITRLELNIPVMSTCGKNECIPEWQISATFLDISEPFVIGSERVVTIQINITNMGDNSLLSELDVAIPPDVALETVPHSCKEGDVVYHWYCMSETRFDNGEQRLLYLNLNVASLKSPSLEVNISANSFSTSISVNASASVRAIKISKIGLDTIAPRYSFVQQCSAPRSIVHRYEVFVLGYTPVSGIWMTFMVPLRFKMNNVWHPAVNVTVQSKLANCAENPFIKSISKFEDGVEVEYTTEECELTDTLPLFEIITLDLKMSVDCTKLEALLVESQELDLTTVAKVIIIETKDEIIANLTTTLTLGWIHKKSDPYLWVYIVFAVFIAMALLVIFIYILNKFGYFDRYQPPRSEEEERDEINQGNNETESFDCNQ